ncbi:hypothetical protein AgCh_021635 [Apium graveolens]
MEDFERVVKISSSEAMSVETLKLLRNFINIQQRRAQAYAHLKSGFADYMVSGSDAAYQQLCSEVTVEFNDCSKQVLEMESLFMSPAYGREDLAHLLRSVQIKEKQKLNLVSLYFFALVLTTVSKIPGRNSRADIQRHYCMNSICLLHYASLNFETLHLRKVNFVTLLASFP